VRLVEPFKSAQVFYFWKGPLSPTGDGGVAEGSRTYYKKVKRGWFKKRIVLMVWNTSGEWRKSAHPEAPAHLACGGIVIEFGKSKKERLQLQVEDAVEKRLDADDRAWSREQKLFVAKRAIARDKMVFTDRAKKMVLDNSTVPALIDGFISKHRGDA